MVVDSSAVVSIFLRRDGYQRLIDRLAETPRAGIGAPTLAEAHNEIAAAAGKDVHGLVARFVQEFDLTVIPFSDAHTRAAASAFEKFGRGRNALDFGDCLAYATARLARQPLLTDDARFRKTDLDLVAEDAADA